jgi:hypothetical protein
MFPLYLKSEIKYKPGDTVITCGSTYTVAELIGVTDVGFGTIYWLYRLKAVK